MIYPGPAVLPLVRSKLSERQVQALLARAKAAGLLSPGRVDYGDMGTIGISDAPTTTLTLNAGGRHIVRSAYALGITAPGNRMPAKVAAARKALAGFIAKLPSSHRGAVWAPHGLAVFAAPFTGARQQGAKPIVWPLTRNLATAGKRASSGLPYRCMVVTGAGREDAARLARARRTSSRSGSCAASRRIRISWSCARSSRISATAPRSPSSGDERDGVHARRAVAIRRPHRELVVVAHREVDERDRDVLLERVGVDAPARDADRRPRGIEHRPEILERRELGTVDDEADRAAARPARALGDQRVAPHEVVAVELQERLEARPRAPSCRSSSGTACR